MILKTTEASKYLGVSINTLKTLSNRLKLKSFRTDGGHRRFMQEDLDLFMGKIKEAIDYIKDRIENTLWEHVEEIKLRR